MKAFFSRLTPYVVGIILLWTLGWYQAKFHAPEGDLIRTGFLLTNRYYPNTPPSTPVRDSTNHDILLVGDSYLDALPLSRRYQQHLNIPVNSHSHWAYDNPTDIFSLGIALANEQPTELIVFEVVERSLFRFAKIFLERDSIPKPKIKHSFDKPKESSFSHIANGVRTIFGLFNIRHKWLQNDWCLVLPCINACPLYSETHILLTRNDWKKRKSPKEVLKVIDDLKNALSAKLLPQNIDFLIYIIPDKSTVYMDFFDSPDLLPSYLLQGPLPHGIHSPVVAMREAVHSETMEVYKYSDTHLAEAGAKITGEHLDEILKQWKNSTPN